jgi:O-acetyl-ADP-ribose deacetylase
MEVSGRYLVIGGTRLCLTRGDITRSGGDAVVNAANSGLMGGGGVDGAIHAAGGPAILAACREIVARRGRLPAGEAVITTGGKLPAAYVIHTVGPVWHGGRQGEPEVLASAYRSCLELAAEKGLRTISFPSVSTGVYGYPVDLAARVALGTTLAFLKERSTSLREVVFVLFSLKNYDAFDAALDEIKP